LEIRESKPGLVKNPAGREDAINRPYAEEIEFKLPRRLPCIACSFRRFDHQTEDALPRGKGQIVNVVDARGGSVQKRGVQRSGRSPQRNVSSNRRSIGRLDVQKHRAVQPKIVGTDRALQLAFGWRNPRIFGLISLFRPGWIVLSGQTNGNQSDAEKTNQY
jgi:hypothetical protein